jgi:ubiquitin carboxyl-terminal hydrolase 36/42
MIPEDATLNCESPLESSEDMLQQDSESNNKSLHKMDIKDQESDLGLHTSIEAEKFVSNEVDLLGSPVLHVLEDTSSPLEASTSLRSVPLIPPVESGPTMSSVELSEVSSVHSFAEQREEPTSCTESVDYMDVDTEAGTEVERCDERQPALGGSILRMDNKTSVPILANGMAVKPKSTFALGFLDKPSRKRPSFAEEDLVNGNNAGSSRKLNGHCNEYLSGSDQGVLPDSYGNSLSSRSEKCNGDILAKSSNGKYCTVNSDTQSSNSSVHADRQDVPFVSHGFEPRPYSEPSSINKNCSSTSSGKPSKASQGDLSFLPRGFLARPSRRNSVKVDDCLPFGNGTSSSFGNGNSKPSNNSRESGILGTSSDIPMEQKSNGSAVVPDHVEEMGSNCTINGSLFQVRAAPDYLGESSHSFFATSNTSCRQENGDGTPSVNDMGCQRDDTPSMLVSKKSMGSEHDGLRRRVTSKFFEQNGIDAQ